jgi:nucleoside-diphosphate-sugar epimerase
VKALLERGYQVFNLDVASPREQLCPFIQVDLTDYGQVMEALSAVDDRYKGIDGVVHLGAIPAPGIRTNAVTFHNNSSASYNVFEAARKLNILNVVWASSETVLGLPFDEPPPYVPVDEEYVGRPQSAYSLAKWLDEQMAQQFCRWNPQLKMIGLRLSNVMEVHDYARFPSFDGDALARKWNLWGYIDARDAAQAIWRSLEYTGKGCEIFIIANADTVMSRSNQVLMAEVFPNVPFRREVGVNETLLSIDKARRILGYEPQFSWRNEISVSDE